MSYGNWPGAICQPTLRRLFAVVQVHHGALEALLNTVSRCMHAISDDPASADPDILDQPPVTGEHPSIEAFVSAPPGKQGMSGIEGDDVGPHARNQNPDPAS